MLSWALLRWAWSELSTDEVSASSKDILYLISPSVGVFCHAGAKNCVSVMALMYQRRLFLLNVESMDRSVGVIDVL